MSTWQLKSVRKIQILPFLCSVASVRIRVISAKSMSIYCFSNLCQHSNAGAGRWGDGEAGRQEDLPNSSLLQESGILMRCRTFHIIGVRFSTAFARAAAEKQAQKAIRSRNYCFFTAKSDPMTSSLVLLIFGNNPFIDALLQLHAAFLRSLCFVLSQAVRGDQRTTWITFSSGKGQPENFRISVCEIRTFSSGMG